MKKIPQHLPAPFCNIRDHETRQRIKIILAAAGFGLLAGLTGASIMLGWIWPGFGGEDMLAVSQLRSDRVHQQLDEKVRDEKVNGRLALVYATAVPFGQTVTLGQKDKLGDAMIVGSDGWLAMYRPAGIQNYKNWRVILSDGSFYRLEKAFFDRYAGLAYLKLAKNKTSDQDSIQLNNLVDFREADLKAGDDIFIFKNNEWYHGLATYEVRRSETIPHLDTMPSLFFALDGVYSAGAVAVNNQGRVVGIVTDKNLLLPVTYMARILPRVLSEEKIAYPTLGVEGWLDTEQPIIIDRQNIHGFAVARVFSGAILKKGDIITEVNGQIVDRDKMWYNKGQVLQLKVWRNGKFLGLEVKVSETN